MMAERLEINPAVVDKVLNHRSGVVRGVAAVYQRGQYLKERKAALSRWGDFLKNLLPNYNQKTVNIQKKHKLNRVWTLQRCATLCCILAGLSCSSS
jgi:hypothetical protein